MPGWSWLLHTILVVVFTTLETECLSSGIIFNLWQLHVCTLYNKSTRSPTYIVCPSSAMRPHLFIQFGAHHVFDGKMAHAGLKRILADLVYLVFWQR
jgi:hypothetical protein